MEKEFDFNSIGKRTPFRTPEGFFERMQAENLRRVAEEKRKKKLYRLKWGVSVALAVAAMVCGIIFFPSRSSPLLSSWVLVPFSSRSVSPLF